MTRNVFVRFVIFLQSPGCEICLWMCETATGFQWKLKIPLVPLAWHSGVFPTGVIDDRGKFISITPAELDSVAQFIRQRGRVSISELAQASNSLINLTPKSRSAAWQTQGNRYRPTKLCGNTQNQKNEGIILKIVVRARNSLLHCSCTLKIPAIRYKQLEFCDYQ